MSSEQQFIDEFSEFLAELIQSSDRFILCGDFNLLSVKTELIDDRLLIVFEQFGMVQDVVTSHALADKKDGFNKLLVTIS